jgi:hypothetical protein
MGYQVFYTILGGFLSAAVGAGLFFLQRYLDRGDEQQRILFQIYQLITIPSVPASGGDTFEISAQLNIADQARGQEIRSLATRIKDQELAAEVFSYKRWAPDFNNPLIEKIVGRLNPELLKRKGIKTDKIKGKAK